MIDLSKYSDDQLQQARQSAAGLDWQSAADCFDADYGFASHVTTETKIEYRQKYIDSAVSIEAGEQDHNFTIRQRMEYALTGTSTPLLS